MIFSLIKLIFRQYFIFHLWSLVFLTTVKFNDNEENLKLFIIYIKTHRGHFEVISEVSFYMFLELKSRF